MKPIAVIGVLLLLAGIAVLVWPVFSYTDTDTVLDAGPLKVQTENKKHVALPPIAGGAAIVAGVALVVVSNRRRAA
jgi:hypothetical protein